MNLAQTPIASHDSIGSWRRWILARRPGPEATQLAIESIKSKSNPPSQPPATQPETQRRHPPDLLSPAGLSNSPTGGWGGGGGGDISKAKLSQIRPHGSSAGSFPPSRARSSRRNEAGDRTNISLKGDRDRERLAWMPASSNGFPPPSHPSAAREEVKYVVEEEEINT